MRPVILTAIVIKEYKTYTTKSITIVTIPITIPDIANWVWNYLKSANKDIPITTTATNKTTTIPNVHKLSSSLILSIHFIFN